MRTVAGRRRAEGTSTRRWPCWRGIRRRPRTWPGAAQPQRRPPQRRPTSGGRAPTWSGASASRRPGGHDLIAAKALHNLGYCDLLAGDIPAALQLFDAAADGYRLSAPGFLPVLAMDKARALLAVGLRQ